MREIMTRDFGKIEIDEDKIFTFPDGLFAFEECRQFALISPLGEDIYPMWLQCIDDVVPCFIVFDPKIVISNYTITLNTSEKKQLALENEDEARCLSIAVVPEDYRDTTINLKSPVVINPKNNTALQVILPEKYDIRFPIYNKGGGE